LGAQLLQKPAKLGRLVEALAAALPVPVTVKIRTGWSAAEINAPEIARICEAAGAAAIACHGRSREARYTRAADWELIGQIAAERSIPVVGNGDILTHYEASDRLAQSGCSGLMLARGALIKPWLFREVKTGSTWLPTAVERLGVTWRLLELMREHFRDDDKGRRRILKFLPWHLDFFCRYRPLPRAEFGAVARQHPLLQTRFAPQTDLEPLEFLLRDPRATTHERLAKSLVASADFAVALAEAERLATEIEPPLTDADWEIAPQHVTG
jgi:tRNA-dihydrouridine synthase 3